MPYIIIIIPQIILIQFNVLSVNLALKKVIRVDIPKNQSVDATATPRIKNWDIEGSNVARKAPNIMVPSIMA